MIRKVLADVGGASSDWVADVLARVDARDADGFAAFLAPDVVFRFGSAEPVSGREAVREYVAGFLAGLAGVAHTVEESWEMADATIVRGTVAYTLPSGDTVTVPFCNVIRRVDGLAREYQIYVDPTPLARG